MAITPAANNPSSLRKLVRFPIVEELGDNRWSTLSQRFVTSELAKKADKSTKVNGKPLSADVSLSAADVGALPATNGLVKVKTTIQTNSDDSKLVLERTDSDADISMQFKGKTLNRHFGVDQNGKLRLSASKTLTSGETVYTTGNKPTPADIGAVASSEFNSLVQEAVRIALEQAADQWHPVGHVLITNRADNPNTYGYKGEWVLQEQDRTIYACTDPELVGTSHGANIVAVPLPRHAHTSTAVSLNGDFSTITDGAHRHALKGTRSDGYTAYGPNAIYTTSWGGPMQYQNHAQWDGVLVDGSGHGHVTRVTFGDHAHGITAEGTDNAVMDVRGAFVYRYVWVRTK